MTSPDERVVPGEPPSSAAPAPAAEAAPVPVENGQLPDLLSAAQPAAIGIVIPGQPDPVPPDNAGWAWVVLRAIDSKERADNLIRIMWAASGIVAICVGAISVLIYFDTQYHVLGGIGVAATAIALISRPASKAARWLQGRRQAKK